MKNFRIILLLIFSLSFGFSSLAQQNNWRQYSSSLAGLKVNYPSDWTSSEMAYNKVWHLSFRSPGVRDDDVWESAGIGICIQPKGHISTSSISTSRCSRHDDHLSEIAKDKVVAEETIELGGLRINKKTTENKYRPTMTRFYASFSDKNREFLMSGYFQRRFNLEQYIPIFDQMLKTIRVLNEREILSYRNDKYDFELTYPTSWKSCSVSVPQNKDEEEFLLLVPEGRSCNGGNYISVSRMTKLSNEKNNRNLEEFLKDKIFTKIIPYIEFGNIHASLGEKTDEKYIYRERYFYTNYPQTYELLKIREMCEITNETCIKEAKEIFTTARRFLKVQ